MPGLFGVINLRGSVLPLAASDMMSVMLSSSRREDFYEDLSCADAEGGFFFASRGLPGLGKRIAPFDGSKGLTYGSVSRQAAGKDSWLSGLKGFFSLACADGSGEFWVVADKRSSEPVYYATCGDSLCFAPEVRALAALPRVAREKDPAAFASLLVSGHLYADQTLFRGIRRLQGGHVLHVRNGNVEVSEYWRFTPGGRARSSSPDSLAAILAGEVGAAVGRDLSGATAEETAIFLSGGHDSRAILGAAMAIWHARDVRTVTWGLDENEPHSDALVASEMARTTGTRHLFLKRGVSGYGRSFEESCFHAEWQSDVPAYHPEEAEIMRRLRSAGFRRVLRGDETFGWKRRVRSRSAALLLAGLRPFHATEGIENILQPKAHREMSEASRDVWDRIAKDIYGMEPNQAKDYLYFNERLQNYLNSAAAHKRAILDHRNPLLADEILDFLGTVPDELREHKEILKMAIRRGFPAVANFPVAAASGLEDWSGQLRERSSLRIYVEKQLADKKSAVWEMFRRDAMENLLAAGPSAKLGYSVSGLAAKAARHAGRSVLGAFSPKAKDYFRASLGFAAPPDPTKIIMRFLVIKNWFDVHP